MGLFFMSPFMPPFMCLNTVALKRFLTHNSLPRSAPWRSVARSPSTLPVHHYQHGQLPNQEGQGRLCPRGPSVRPLPRPRGKPWRCPQGVHAVQSNTLLRPGLPNRALAGGAQAVLRDARGANAAACVAIFNAYTASGRRSSAGGVRRVPGPARLGRKPVHVALHAAVWQARPQ